MMPLVTCRRCRSGFHFVGGDRQAELCNSCCVQVGYEASRRLLANFPHAPGTSGMQNLMQPSTPTHSHVYKTGREAEARLYAPGMYQNCDHRTGDISAIGACGFGTPMKPEHSGCLPDINAVRPGVCL